MKKVLPFIVFILCGVIGLVVRFSNPSLTETQLFFKTWYLIPFAFGALYWHFRNEKANL